MNLTARKMGLDPKIQTRTYLIGFPILEYDLVNQTIIEKVLRNYFKPDMMS